MSTKCREPFDGLTQLLASPVCDWKDVKELVTRVRDPAYNVSPAMGLGQRLYRKTWVPPASLDGHPVPQRPAWSVAIELAKAYNSMLVEGGHAVPLTRPDLPMKGLTEGCRVLRPQLLQVEVEIGRYGWAARVPPLGEHVTYPILMQGTAMNRDNGCRAVFTMRMHRFVCFLARGPPPGNDREVCHACSNRACVRPSNLRWDTRTENNRGRTIKRRRRWVPVFVYEDTCPVLSCPVLERGCPRVRRHLPRTIRQHLFRDDVVGPCAGAAALEGLFEPRPCPWPS